MKQMFGRRRRHDLLRPLGLAAARRRRDYQWLGWVGMLLLMPALAFGAYQPAFLAAANNLSDLASAATARTNLGVPAATRTINTTAPVTGGGDLTADRTLAVSVATATTTGLLPTPPNDVTKVLRGDATYGTAPTPLGVAPVIYTGTLPLTLTAIDGLFEVIEMATPAAGVINLPATPTAGLPICIKDGKKNFQSNNVTVKTTDSSTIDKVAGATGYVMDQNGQQTCFKYASSGTNWYVY